MKKFSLEKLQVESTENDLFAIADEEDGLESLKRTLDIPQNLSSFKKQRPTSPTLTSLSNRLIETYAEARSVCFKGGVDAINNSKYLKMLDTQSSYLTGLAQLKNKTFTLKQLFDSDEDDDLLNGKVPNKK